MRIRLYHYFVECIKECARSMGPRRCLGLPNHRQSSHRFLFGTPIEFGEAFCRAPKYGLLATNCHKFRVHALRVFANLHRHPTMSHHVRLVFFYRCGAVSSTSTSRVVLVGRTNTMQIVTGAKSRGYLTVIRRRWLQHQGWFAGTGVWDEASVRGQHAIAENTRDSSLFVCVTEDGSWLCNLLAHSTKS